MVTLQTCAFYFHLKLVFKKKKKHKPSIYFLYDGMICLPVACSIFMPRKLILLFYYVFEYISLFEVIVEKIHAIVKNSFHLL